MRTLTNLGALRSLSLLGFLALNAPGCADVADHEAPVDEADLGDLDGVRVLGAALTATDDILITTRGSRSSACVTVGFALETGDARSEARRKLADKSLDFIVANDALEDGAGFAIDTNRVTIVHADGREESLPLQSKTQVADEILDRVEELLRGR